jgi:hypothetical protein
MSLAVQVESSEVKLLRINDLICRYYPRRFLEHHVDAVRLEL